LDGAVDVARWLLARALKMEGVAHELPSDTQDLASHPNRALSNDHHFGTPPLTAEEIEAEIQAYRAERRRAAGA